jgi:beta-lactamase class A
MVRSFLLLTYLAVSAASGENDPATRFAAIEAQMGGRIGVAAFETGNSKHLDYRAEEQFPMCSTLKFLAVAAVLKRVDESGRSWIGSCLMAQRTSWKMLR